MKSYKHFTIILGILAIGLTACVPQKKITYFQDRDTTKKAFAIDTSYNATIQPNDILNIYVTSTSEDASKYFNFSENPADESSLINGYLVDETGTIQLPLVGSVHVSGLTSIVARDTIKSRLGKYLVNPAVKVSIRNFRITVLGEVVRPGIVSVGNEKITLTDALAMAGDLSLYGRRDNILVVRDSKGKKEFAYVDINGREFFSSPFYNLHANDIIYVEAMPQKKFQMQTWWRISPIILGIVSAIYVGIRISQ
jgi:polysaccharide export outer membrane protein